MLRYFIHVRFVPRGWAAVPQESAAVWNDCWAISCVRCWSLPGSFGHCRFLFLSDAEGHNSVPNKSSEINISSNKRTKNKFHERDTRLDEVKIRFRMRMKWFDHCRKTNEKNDSLECTASESNPALQEQSEKLVVCEYCTATNNLNVFVMRAQPKETT